MPTGVTLLGSGQQRNDAVVIRGHGTVYLNGSPAAATVVLSPDSVLEGLSVQTDATAPFDQMPVVEVFVNGDAAVQTCINNCGIYGFAKSYADLGIAVDNFPNNYGVYLGGSRAHLYSNEIAFNHTGVLAPDVYANDFTSPVTGYSVARNNFEEGDKVTKNDNGVFVTGSVVSVDLGGGNRQSFGANYFYANRTADLVWRGSATLFAKGNFWAHGFPVAATGVISGGGKVDTTNSAQAGSLRPSDVGGAGD